MEISFNNLDHLDDFIEVNKQWILVHFERDKIDRELVKRPEEVLNEGGYFVSAYSEESVYGICVLHYLGDGNFELANLSVSPAFQGKGYGKALVEASIAKLAELKAKSVIVQTNSNLKSALSLYERHGFVLESDQLPPNVKRNNLLLRKNF